MAAWYFLRVVDESGLVDEWSRFWLRLFLICCLPWYAYHSIDWSQSLATSFLVLSVSLLIRALRHDRCAWRQLCAVRDLPRDQPELCVGLVSAPSRTGGRLLVRAPDSPACRSRTPWHGSPSVIATLMPWMVYSWRATGAPLVKSTNQGHVLLIGLGQDPRHRFATTYSDYDPCHVPDSQGTVFAALTCISVTRRQHPARRKR